MEKEKESLDIKVYTLPETAELLKVSRVSLLNYIKAGKLKAKKAVGRWLITEDAIKEFIGGK